jgi:hypothetical protein
MTVLPKSSDIFVFMCSQSANAVDYGASLRRAVDGLQRYAMQNGLVDRLGQDAVQRIMSHHFRGVRKRPR